MIIIIYDAPHQHEQNDSHTEKQKQSQHIPLSQQHPSLYGMAHSINSITTMTTVQFLLGMEPHILTLWMTTIIIMVQMITHTVTPSIWMIHPTNYSSHSASKRYNSTITSKTHIISIPRRSTHKPYRNKNNQANIRRRRRHTTTSTRHHPTNTIIYSYHF